MTLSPATPSLKIHRSIGRRLRHIDRELEQVLTMISAHFGSKSAKPLMDAQRNLQRVRQVLSIELYRGYPLDENGNLAGVYFGD